MWKLYKPFFFVSLIQSCRFSFFNIAVKVRLILGSCSRAAKCGPRRQNLRGTLHLKTFYFTKKKVFEVKTYNQSLI